MAETDAIKPDQDDTPVKPVILAEPEAAIPPAPPSPAKRRGGFAGPVLGGVIAAGLGFGLAQYVPQLWPQTQTATPDPAIAAQAAEISNLKAELARLSAQPAPDAGLAERVAALEATPVATVDLGPLAGRIAALEERLSAIEAIPTDGAAASPAAMAAQAQALKALQDEVAALKSGADTGLSGLAQQAEARLKEATAAAEALKAETQALGAATRAQTALGLVMAAMESGAPFAGALPDLGEVPEALSSQAAAGVPTLQALRDSFPEAARQALEASLRADMGATWAERIGSFLKSQTGARSLTAREGSDPDAVLSRAEAALGKGDLAVALAELDALPEAGKVALTDWRGRAAARQAAQAALAELAARIAG
jgi:hypothetical protein